MERIFDIGEYFTEKAIIKILCKKRALAAKKNHDKHYLRNISNAAKNPNTKNSDIIYSLFPSRRNWIRANKKERIGRNTNTVELNAIQLERTVGRAFKKFNGDMANAPAWLLEIQKFTSDLRSSALDHAVNYEIPKPTIRPQLKDKRKKYYRPICSYELKDLIIISQSAKYLTNCFDQLFLNCSYAFRTGINNEKKFNHHQAIRDLIEFKEEHLNYYVAECDIKKFFDCVSHEEITIRFDEFVKRAETTLSITIHDRAKYLFLSYLKSFSFSFDIAQCESQILKSSGINAGSIPWITEQEFKSIGIDATKLRIGVPQGGALSCLIANIILHQVDQEILAKDDGQLFYARFCDDMILVHPDLSYCTNVFQIYQKALIDAKLVCHKPEELVNYDKNFWEIKSKLPYLWDNYEAIEEKKKNVPWLSFVGYQVRYDNLVRIRKSSIEKELKKQVKETGKILRVFKQVRRSKINRRAIVFRLTQRLFRWQLAEYSIQILKSQCVGLLDLMLLRTTTKYRLSF